MGYGIKASRNGYDVTKASDRELAFSSEWPLLPIEAEDEVTLTAPGGGGDVNQNLIRHDLGYPPVFTTVRVSGNPFYWQRWIYATDTHLVFDGYLTADITIKYKLFRRNILTDFASDTNPVTDLTRGVDNKYGLKVSLPGKSALSTDKRDFGIRSDVRQLMISKSGFTKAASISEEFVHNLGYKPMYFIYDEDPADSGKWYQTASADDLSIAVDETKIDLTFFTLPFFGHNWAYIIFKNTLVNNA